MAKAKKSATVPPAMQEKFDRITALTDTFAKKHLDDEYAELIRLATAALCRKRPSPLATGKDATWACGITHAIGMVNFLFDPSQKPHISASEIYSIFGIAASTGQGKSKIVRDALKMSPMDPDWSRPSLLSHNPLAWMITVNGYIMDARSAPRPIQEIAFAQGMIPYIPDAEGNPVIEVIVESVKKTIPESVENPIESTSTDSLYTLQAYITNGPMTDKFITKNPVVSRTIVIQGNQTLADLHQILFQAFNRKEEHLYEFQIGGSGPFDPEAQRYGLPSANDFEDSKPVKSVRQSRIDSLGLTVDQVFGYWFDFGDDWHHQIDVIAIDSTVPKGKYPKITERVGASPPQYAF
jgi:hypothetical protein